MKTRLTPGQRKIRALATEIKDGLVRLQHKARLVASNPVPGHSLTALRNTAALTLQLLEDVIQPRCNVCGCTSDDCSQCIEKTGYACSWVSPDLCSACKEAPL